MFENLTNKFEEIFSSLKKAPSLDEKQVDEGLRAIRLALLEASNKARRIARNPSSTCFSSREGAFFKEEKISSNLFVKFSNIISHSRYRTSGRTLADWCRSLCYQRHRKLLYFAETAVNYNRGSKSQ